MLFLGEAYEPTTLPFDSVQHCRHDKPRSPFHHDFDCALIENPKSIEFLELPTLAQDDFSRV